METKFVPVKEFKNKTTQLKEGRRLSLQEEAFLLQEPLDELKD